jgi:recombination protein RecA
MALDTLIREMQRKYGKKVSWGKDVTSPGRLSTGSLALDVGLAGGIPRSKITTICGKKSVCKTAFAFHAVAEAQREGRPAAWVSMEPFDAGWAEINGVDLNALYLAQPENGDEAVDIYDVFLKTKDFGIIVLDSVGALIPAEELNGDVDKYDMGKRAKLAKKLLMRANAALQPSKEGKINECACLLINHIYDSMNQWPPYVIAGGKAIEFFSALILRFHSEAADDVMWEAEAKKSDPVGLNVHVFTEKDKTRGKVKPFEFRFYNRDGHGGSIKGGHFDDVTPLIRLGQCVPTLEDPLIKRGGAWFTLADGSKIQGEDAFWDYLIEHPEVSRELEEKIRKFYLEKTPTDI